MDQGYTTRKRSRNETLYRILTISEGDYPKPEISISEMGTLFSGQTTYSFRTSSKRPRSFEEQAGDFTTVTRNGFTELTSKEDTGHEFWTRKYKRVLNRRAVKLTYRDYSWGRKHVYQGPLVPVIPGRTDLLQEFPAVELMSENDVSFYGQKAIANTVPTRPAANVTTAVAELLFNRLPNLIGDLPKWGKKAEMFRNTAKYAGDRYLNSTFGWTPFIKDIVDVCEAVAEIDKIIQQLYRDSGPDKWVRRRYSFEPSLTTTVEEFSSGQISPALQAQATFYGPATLMTTTRKEMWFSGAYSYFLNDPSGLLEKSLTRSQLVAEFLGGRITPDTLWNLAPWSWLVDWMANVGDAISNMQAFQEHDLVLKYGYLMQKTVITRTVSIDDVVLSDRKLGTVSDTFAVTQLERRKATPYGFGLDPSLFSGDQWAILVALGLSRGGKPSI